MTTLADLALAAQRYRAKRSRSQSQSGSSSGYGSILSDSEEENGEDESILGSHDPLQQPVSSTSQPTTCNGEHRKLDITNKGMQLLLKMGWTEGTGLGINETGRKEPIPTPAQTPLLGLGKSTQDAYMLSAAIAKPKELESLVIARETEESRAKREEKVKVVQMREEEREDRLRSFYCAICDKGYTTISQFEEHERSYAHHHARRALEAKQARRAGKPSAEARIEKERKREAKELQRMARAAGVTVQPPRAIPSDITLKVGSTVSKSGFKKAGGWAPITASNTTESQTLAANMPVPFNKTAPGDKPNFSVPKFKSAGFTPISLTQSSSTQGPSGSQDIGPAATQKLHSSGPSPTFVASSSASTSFQPSMNQAASKASTGSTSKFAQIAARLAAQRAAGTLTQKTGPKPKIESFENSELERMLDEGV
ncbi:hypothetical protein O181_003936 [Austropuccinia psidii MF-1]|uniref:G-patch domain-containing protein n=1 Tax=Austropuccinia psidii MF-1 TaxID=1389203 RepID=A0A9Q3BEK1_9BASI|nr:hypothetical protein [Austropuccinia psidii MF-1]